MLDSEEGAAAGRQPGWAAHLPPSDRQMDEISAVFAILRPDDGGDDTVCGFAPSIDFCAVKAGLRGMGFDVEKGELQSQLEHCCPHALQKDRFFLEDFAAVVRCRSSACVCPLAPARFRIAMGLSERLRVGAYGHSTAGDAIHGSAVNRRPARARLCIARSRFKGSHRYGRPQPHRADDAPPRRRVRRRPRLDVSAAVYLFFSHPDRTHSLRFCH